MTIDERNRNNATHSTGPRTIEGKAIASQNARKHGLAIQRHILLPTEDPADFESLRQDLHAIYNPQSDRESVAVEDMAQCRWAIQRVDAEELRLLSEASEDDPFPPKLLLLQRYRGYWERRHDRALRDFRQSTLDRQRAQREQHKLRLLEQQAEVGEMDLENRRHQQRMTSADRVEWRRGRIWANHKQAERRRLDGIRADRELGFVSSPDTCLVRLATQEDRDEWAKEENEGN